MGVPTLALILAENQEPLAQSAEELGVSKNLGWAKNLDNERLKETLIEVFSDEIELQKMSVAGMKVVDGLGAKRLCDHLQQN